MLQADPVLFEPVQTLRIDAPAEYMGGISRIIQSRRGQILEMDQDEDHLIVKARMPVAESFGFTTSLRSETAGRGFWTFIDSKFERIPRELQNNVVKKIRERKGLPQIF